MGTERESHPVPVPRPLTFTFMANLLQALGAHLHEARINRLVADIFYAVAVIAGPGGIRTVDARPIASAHAA
jgi:bifunctional DNase/RNase